MACKTVSSISTYLKWNNLILMKYFQAGEELIGIFLSQWADGVGGMN